MNQLVDALLVIALALLWTAIGVAGAWAVAYLTEDLWVCVGVWVVGWAVAGALGWGTLTAEPAAQ